MKDECFGDWFWENCGKCWYNQHTFSYNYCSHEIIGNSSERIEIMAKMIYTRHNQKQCPCRFKKSST